MAVPQVSAQGKDAPDTGAAATVDGHTFAPPVGRRWGRCGVCGLSQAAHKDPGAPYVSDAPRALPVRTNGSR